MCIKVSKINFESFIYITFEGKHFFFIMCLNCDCYMIAFSAYGDKITRTIKGLFDYLLLD